MGLFRYGPKRLLAVLGLGDIIAGRSKHIADNLAIILLVRMSLPLLCGRVSPMEWKCKKCPTTTIKPPKSRLGIFQQQSVRAAPPEQAGRGENGRRYNL
jgi:hypothetical protein